MVCSKHLCRQDQLYFSNTQHPFFRVSTQQRLGGVGMVELDTAENKERKIEKLLLIQRQLCEANLQNGGR